MFQKIVDRYTDETLVIFDVDFMMAFNDLHGHTTGDQALEAVASVLQPIFRSLHRVGGDEFAALCNGTQEWAAKATERCLSAVGGLELPFQHPEVSIPHGPFLTLTAIVTTWTGEINFWHFKENAIHLGKVQNRGGCSVLTPREIIENDKWKPV